VESVEKNMNGRCAAYTVTQTHAGVVCVFIIVRCMIRRHLLHVLCGCMSGVLRPYLWKFIGNNKNSGKIRLIKI